MTKEITCWIYDKCASDRSRDRNLLALAWNRAQKREPCDLCEKVTLCHYPTCCGLNICKQCYDKEREIHKTQEIIEVSTVIQCYPGDQGYPPAWF